MATQSEVTSRPSAAGAPERRGAPAETPVRPPVDIYEDDEGITLCADMPGVSKERLELRVEANTLILEGTARLDLPQNAEALYADVRSSTYRRTFALSGELETDKIDANLKDGVLTVRIPKRSEVRPRRIEVRTG
ncbi:MAG: Hsp20/alpha crystallin family protein [Steroidobacteraceae bacterium]